MSAAVASQLSGFAADVLTGLTDPRGKWLLAKYFYDDLGSALFEAITLLPEYGLTRADEHLLFTHAAAITRIAGQPATVVELGSGSGRKTRHLLSALDHPVYCPIDISRAALAACVNQLQDVAVVQPQEGEWLSSLQRIVQERPADPMLLLFLGSTIGNFNRADLPVFFQSIRSSLRSGDSFLLGADLVKPIPTMLAAYNDPTGVTAAFNLNVLARINREFDADFDLRRFIHESRWNARDRSIEMHLVSRTKQTVHISALESDISFEQGESIWTESSHKFTLEELEMYAASAGFAVASTWVGQDWPFAEVLWRPV